MVMTPNPPICMSSNITTCPKTLQVVTVGTVTSPVTQVAVVAVKSASKKGTDLPFAELKGRLNKTLPAKITVRKPNNMSCDVESLKRIFFFINQP